MEDCFGQNIRPTAGPLSPRRRRGGFIACLLLLALACTCMHPAKTHAKLALTIKHHHHQPAIATTCNN
eukprot:scaffold118478_cov62-Cyclotella_meneghiniana.AAC.5